MTKNPDRLTPQMHHVLELASRQGVDVWQHGMYDDRGRRAQSRTVGRCLTIATLQARGWLDGKGQLTPQGRERLNRARENIPRA